MIPSLYKITERKSSFKILEQKNVFLVGQKNNNREGAPKVFMDMSLGFWVRITLLLLLLAAIVAACFTLPIEQMLKDFLYWVDQDLGRWGPVVLAVAYIPLTILAVPASVLTLGGGYLYGLLVGIIADSIGATLGSTAAFLLGRTIGGSYVISKVKDYPKFRAIEVAVEKSGFKIVLLLRLVPLLSFNLLNYLLSVTPVSLWEYVLASWLGMLPITVALVYAGTTLKDLSDVTHGWNDLTPSHWVFLVLSFVVSVILMVWVTKVAKNALDESLAEIEVAQEKDSEHEPFVSGDHQQDLEQHLIGSVPLENGESQT